MDEKVYVESYMADYGLGFMVSQDFRQAHLQEVGLTQISGDHGFLNIFSSMIGFVTYYREDSITYFKIDIRTNKHRQVILSN